jgi:hypothetical protein
MGKRVISGCFATEQQFVDAVRAVRKREWDVVDLYCPYPVHGLEEMLGWRSSRLPIACLVGGLSGVGAAFWLQYWTSAQNWPINVGGRPWNSLPAFVPVAFESMVLLAGLGLVVAWLLRCGLYPGRAPQPVFAGVTDDRFALAVREPHVPNGSELVSAVLQECQATALSLREAQELQ